MTNDTDMKKIEAMSQEQQGKVDPDAPTKNH